MLQLQKSSNRVREVSLTGPEGPGQNRAKKPPEENEQKNDAKELTSVLDEVDKATQK
jgi:hypothetical protein